MNLPADDLALFFRIGNAAQGAQERLFSVDSYHVRTKASRET